MKGRVSHSPLRTSLLFTGLTFVQPAVNFLLLPLYLAYLTPSEYGLYALMVTVSVLAHHLAALRVQDAMGPLYFRFGRQPGEQRVFLDGLLQATLVLNVLFLMVALGVGPWIFASLFSDGGAPDFFPYGVLAVLIGVLNSISGPYLGFVKNGRQVRRFAALHLGLVAANVGAQLSLIVVLQRGALGALEARLAGPALLALVALAVSARGLLRRPDWEHLRAAFRFSLPLLPFAAVVWVAAFADRVWIERSFDLTTLGTYSLLLALVTMVTMASHASWNGIQPFLFEELSAKGGPSTRRLQQLARTYFSIPFLVGGALAAGAPLLHALTDEPGYLAVLTFATAGIAVYLTESVSIFLRGLLTHALKPAIISIATTISVAIQFGSYIILIPHFGINGALAGILAGQLILIAILLISLRTKAPQALPSLKILAPPLILIPLFLLPKLMGHFGWIANLWTGILQFSCIFLPILGYFLKKED